MTRRQDMFEKSLIEATNLLGRVAGRLPAGYQLSLHVSRNESHLELINPEGEAVETSGGEWNYSAWSAAIEAAIVEAEEFADQVQAEDYPRGAV